MNLPRILDQDGYVSILPLSRHAVKAEFLVAFDAARATSGTVKDSRAASEFDPPIDSILPPLECLANMLLHQDLSDPALSTIRFALFHFP